MILNYFGRMQLTVSWENPGIRLDEPMETFATVAGVLPRFQRVI
jgi:hypothetical protein